MCILPQDKWSRLIWKICASHIKERHLFLNSMYSISQEICTRFLLCCALLWLYIDWFHISIRLISLALWQSNDCPSASKATLMNMDKYFMWIHYERLHNHNKAKHNKTVRILLGIYCTWYVCPGSFFISMLWRSCKDSVIRPSRYIWCSGTNQQIVVLKRAARLPWHKTIATIPWQFRGGIFYVCYWWIIHMSFLLVQWDPKRQINPQFRCWMCFHRVSRENPCRFGH